MENIITEPIKFFVASDYIALADAKIEKLSKKYTRKGYDILSRITKESGVGKVWAKTNHGLRQIKTAGMNYTIELTMPEIKAGDYKFVGIIKSDDEGFVTVHEMDEYDLTGYEKEEFRCDHCNTNRFRKTVFLFVNDKDEELMIAKSCVREYFGINTEGLIRNITYVIRELQNDFGDDFYGQIADGEWFGMGGGCKFLDTPEFAKLVYGIIKGTGAYTSRNNDMGYGTADMAWRLYDLANMKGLMTLAEIEEAEADKKKTLDLADKFDYDFKKILDYWMDKPVDSTFINNTQVALQKLFGSTGLIAWAVFDYIKEVEGINKTEKKDVEDKVLRVNEFMGNIGEKFEDVIATVVRTRDIAGFAYNTTSRIVTLLTDKGHTLVWFFGNWNADVYPETNMEILIKGKVKKHENYNEWAQTTVNYVKITEVIKNVGEN